MRALTYPRFKLTAEEQRELLADYLPYCTSVVMPAKPPRTPPCRDPFDVPFLQLAVVGKADYLVTGDKDLLKNPHWPNSLPDRHGRRIAGGTRQPLTSAKALCSVPAGMTNSWDCWRLTRIRSGPVLSGADASMPRAGKWTKRSPTCEAEPASIRQWARWAASRRT